MKTLSFKSPLDLRNWLEKNHGTSDGIWLCIFKKDSGEKSITYAEALEECLCYGWIDGQKQPRDNNSWLQKITPRSVKSAWSNVNTKHAERLMKTGRMTRAGLAAVEIAKADGRWQAAYNSQRNAVPPEDFLKALSIDKTAKAFFETLTKANIYSIVYRLQTAKKPETRQKRMKLILEMLARGEKFHPDGRHTDRSDRKPARTSWENSSGCSQAAKCPPFSTLL
jgi:uncharacterized protein YdeI (YjbR/CyaY-like superfamily)